MPDGIRHLLIGQMSAISWQDGYNIRCELELNYFALDICIDRHDIQRREGSAKLEWALLTVVGKAVKSVGSEARVRTM